MQCDICGKESTLFKTKIEGTILNVCDSCSAYGKRLAKVKTKPKTKLVLRPKSKEKVEAVVSNFASIIRNKRESIALKQKDFAGQINEKESIVHKIEVGTFTPSIKLARKIEKFLGVKLVEEVEEKQFNFDTSKKSSGGFTLGDAIKIKKSK